MIDDERIPIDEDVVLLLACTEILQDILRRRREERLFEFARQVHLVALRAQRFLEEVRRRSGAAAPD